VQNLNILNAYLAVKETLAFCSGVPEELDVRLSYFQRHSIFGSSAAVFALIYPIRGSGQRFIVGLTLVQ
jgi:hypothetical protein